MSAYIDEKVKTVNKYVFEGNDKFVFAFALDELREQEPENFIRLTTVLEDKNKSVDIYNALMANDKIEAFNMHFGLGIPIELTIDALILDETIKTTFKLLGDNEQAKFEVLTSNK